MIIKLTWRDRIFTTQTEFQFLDISNESRKRFENLD